MTNAEKYTTVDEREDAFAIYNGHSQESQTGAIVRAAMNWLDREAEEEKPLPCPFCGGETKVDAGHYGNCVFCEKCAYNGPFVDTTEEAISAHNRVAKAVMGSEAAK